MEESLGIVSTSKDGAPVELSPTTSCVLFREAKGFAFCATWPSTNNQPNSTKSAN